MSLVRVTVERDGVPFDELPPRARARLKVGLDTALFGLVSHIQRTKLRGNPLNQQQGDLISSIFAKQEETPSGIEGEVYSSLPAARYGVVHEYGGDYMIPEHWQTRTMIFGREVEPFQVKIKFHSATFPERSFLRSSLGEMKGWITETLGDAMDEALRGEGESA